jgi:hypothetical protein
VQSPGQRSERRSLRWATAANVIVVSAVIFAAGSVVGATPASAQARLQRVDGRVGGEVIDVATSGDAFWISHTDNGTRRLSRVDSAGAVRAGPTVPAGAVAAGVCDNDAVFFVDDRGLTDAAGAVVIKGPPLLSVPDRGALPFVPVCPTPDTRALLVADGMWLQRVTTSKGATTGVSVVAEGLLPFVHRARSYAGQGGRSLRSERPYAAALSLYAPRVFAFDVNADGTDDIVTVHEGHANIFIGSADGVPRHVGERDLGAIVGAPKDAELRVIPVQGGLLVSSSVGALPERCTISAVVGTPTAPLTRAGERVDVDGLALLLGARGRTPLFARIDTSLVALSGVVLTGRVPFDVRLGQKPLMSMPTVADVRAGRVDGAAPVVDVDLDGDGTDDILELGEPKRARLWRETGGEWRVDDTMAVFPLERAVSAPGLRRVLLVGRRKDRSTAVAVVSASSASPRR